MILICMTASGFGVLLIKAAPATIVVPDDYPTIQEAVNGAVDGDTIFVEVGTYYEHVVVNKTILLVGEDVSTTIIDGGGIGHVVYVVRNNVSLTGFTVRNSGNVHMPDLDAGICLNGTRGCVLSGNCVVDNGFAGISILSSQYNKIDSNNVSDTGWGGIHLMNSSRNTVTGNILYSNGRQQQWGGGINGHAGSHYNNITGNTIVDCVYGMFYHDARYNRICRNNISATSSIGIWLQDTVSHNVVAENSLINCTVGIFLEGPNYNNTLLRNTITGSRYGMRIQDYARYTRIAENTIEETGCGIQIQNAVNTEIYNNTIARNYGGEWDAGIRLDYAGYTRIYSNVIADNSRGILVYTGSPYVSMCNNKITGNDFAVRVASGGSNYVNISGNIVMNNRGYGIGLTGFGGASNYATISRNHIVNNSDGIALGQYSSYHTIFHNNISQNDYGFYIEYSTQNTIWGNNFIDNDQQVYISAGSVNTWDNSYPTGGNYWSDYSGDDYFSGPDQDKAGSDGIGDTPFVVDQSNQDDYPLIVPYGWTIVPILGDVNGDWKVDLKDVYAVSVAYGAYGPNYLYPGSPQHPKWKLECDVDKDNKIDLKDYYATCKNFGKSW